MWISKLALRGTQTKAICPSASQAEKLLALIFWSLKCIFPKCTFLGSQLTVFGQFLGTKVKNAKHEKVAPHLDLNYCNQAKQILASIFGSLKYISQKFTFLGPQLNRRGLYGIFLIPSFLNSQLRAGLINALYKKIKKIGKLF